MVKRGPNMKELVVSAPQTKLKATQTPPDLRPNLNNTRKTRRRP
jgi:hypothetical protein